VLDVVRPFYTKVGAQIQGARCQGKAIRRVRSLAEPIYVPFGAERRHTPVMFVGTCTAKPPSNTPVASASLLDAWVRWGHLVAGCDQAFLGPRARRQSAPHRHAREAGEVACLARLHLAAA